MLSSKHVSGENPTWYMKHDRDPLHDAALIYSEMFEWLDLAGDETIVLTGLTQTPYEHPEIYWRLANPQRVVGQILDLPFKAEQLMSRDFNLIFDDEDSAKAAKKSRRCKVYKGQDSTKLWVYGLEVNLFCSFIYSNLENNVTFKYEGVLL